MSIRIGANPIGWTNDDLQEIGGDTPLETCLAEARQAGVVGMEKGHKLPSDGAELKELKGYSGWVVLEAEQDPKKAPALPYAKQGVAHIRPALKEAGLM
jgi:sugar phosphate isomerase/epimerase